MSSTRHKWSRLEEVVFTARTSVPENARRSVPPATARLSSARRGADSLRLNCSTSAGNAAITASRSATAADPAGTALRVVVMIVDFSTCDVRTSIAGQWETG